MNSEGHIRILLAEDDPDDRLLTRRALAESSVSTAFTAVENGEELLHYLRHEEEYDNSQSAPRPDLILLDLNMPGTDGREALREIKSDSELRRIPVVVLTTSEAEQDILQSYDLGVNAFVTKPVTFDALADTMESLGEFWSNLVKLPPERDANE
ncbi:MAG: response regulator [Salinibacter sp.]|uniref:response regulator n=1 Tax=Salinibacter sp. TaxID=2065818 RepID=UPI0035D4201F